jgi:hypothetical protein
MVGDYQSICTSDLPVSQFYCPDKYDSYGAHHNLLMARNKGSNHLTRMRNLTEIKVKKYQDWLKSSKTPIKR